MPIVKRLKNLPLQRSQKKRFFSGKHKYFLPYFVTILFSTLLCTYLELFFTGQGYYSFANRPYPNTFMIDIRFTLIGVPSLTYCVLVGLTRLHGKVRILLVGVLAFVMMIGEMTSENVGLMEFTSSWSHGYSFFGYMIFMILVWQFFNWILRVMF